VRPLSNLPTRLQLLLLAGLAAVPGLALLTWSGVHVRHEAVARARVQSQRLADGIAGQHETVIAGIQQLFVALSRMPQVRGRDPSVQPILAELLAQNPHLINIFVIDRGGVVWSSAVGASGHRSDDRRYFRAALATGRLSVGEYAVSRSTSRPTLQFAYPYRDARGELAGVIGVALSLESYASVLERHPIPPGSSYLLVDRDGLILTRSADRERYQGTPFTPATFAAMRAAPDAGTDVAMTMVGDERVVAWRKVRLPGEEAPYLYVRTGIPIADVLAASNLELRWNLTLALALLVPVMALVVLAGKRWLVDRLALLEAASARMAAGDLDVRVSAQVQGGELGSLAAAFDRMAEQLAARAQALAQAQRLEAVGRLAGGVAHDINNMLAVILGEAELLKAELPQEHPGQQAAAEIERAGARSRDITRQLLAFSRRQVTSPRPVALGAHLAAARSTLDRLVGPERRLAVEVAQDAWPARIDPAQLDQILMNLLVNARDATPAGSVIRVEVGNASLDEAACRDQAGARPGDFVRLRVVDEGVGMDAATLAQVFEPFFTTKGVHQGTGLGLATVYGIAAQSGGFVTARSAPGRGATFEVHLPRSTEAAVEAPAAAAARAGSGVVLLVEDDEPVRRTAHRMLESLGYAVVVAATPEEALAASGDPARRLDVLLTDVMMPGMQGPELRRLVEALRPGLPAVFMSGHAADAHLASDEPGGRAHFLQKPFSRADLADRLREALGR
jgi:signal transduction histidine kinase/CheY-like chemotaxis protein